MNTKLAAALSIFESLGWAEAAPEQAALLPIGTKEQQKTALEGLTKGQWRGVNANHEMLAYYAIRVGVSPRRALQLLPCWRQPELTDVVATRSAAWVTEFINRVCSSDYRMFENAVSVVGETAVELVIRFNLPVPERVDYIKDWAGVVAGHISDYPVENLNREITKKDDLESQFRNHMRVATAIGAPVTGPLGAIPAAAVAVGWLSREEALGFAFTGIEFAVRPGDRKAWAHIITDELHVTDQELLAQAPGLIPVISTAETPVIERLGLRLLPLIGEAEWAELALVMSYAPAAKTLTAVLRSIAANADPSPEAVALLAPRIGELTAHKNAKVVKLSQALLAAWGQEAVVPENEDLSQLYLWQPYPGFQESPRVHIPEVPTAETIMPLLKDLDDEDPSSTINKEVFWTQLVQLCQTDVTTARRLVAGLHNPSLRAWSRGEEIPHPRPKTDDWLRPVSARDVTILMALGNRPVPCLLSQPSFEDMSIDPQDLLRRLKLYATTDGAELIVADLMLALARLRVPTTGVSALQASFRQVVVPVQGATRTAGEVVADYLVDPFKDPGIDPQNGRPKTQGIPASVADCVAQEQLRGHIWDTTRFYATPSIFPLHTEATSFGGCDSRAGLDWISRFGSPLPPLIATEFLTLTESTPEYADAIRRAWQRGILVPGSVDVEHPYQNWDLAKKAATLRLAAELGALAAVWPLLDRLLEHHASKPRVIAGVSDLADLALELAPAVAKASTDGLATRQQAPTAGLTALVEKGGSSQAVRTAKKALDLLPPELTIPMEQQDDQPPCVLLSDEEFAKTWPANQREANNPEDGFTVTLALIDGPTQAKDVQVTLNNGEATYVVVNQGWFYSLEREGQARGEDEQGAEAWLHWDPTTRSLVSFPHRNRIKGYNAPLEAAATPLSDSLVALVFANMQHQLQTCQSDWAIENILRGNLLSVSGVSSAISKLLTSPEYNPTRTFGFLEKHPGRLPVLWPVITQCLAHAAAQEAPPRWASRCLDVATYHAPVLATATAKGIIPASAWEPLRVLAGVKKKSAARMKAQELAKILLTG